MTQRILLAMAFVALASCGAPTQAPSPSELTLAEAIEVGVASAPTVSQSGLYPPEALDDGFISWTDGAARILVPNDQSNPATLVSIALWPFRAPSVTDLQISINGSVVYSGTPEGAWTQSFDVSQYATAPSLQIDFQSNTGSPNGDARRLGFPLKSVQIFRAGADVH